MLRVLRMQLVRRWLGSFGFDEGVAESHASREDGSVPLCLKKATLGESPRPKMARVLRVR
jgi:hypothetical protein